MIDEGRQKHAESEARARENWKTTCAQRLLDAYYKAKKRVLVAGGHPLRTPEEWAGSLMVIHGSHAVDKLLEAKRLGISIPKAPKVKRLLVYVLNAELLAEYGQVSCHACDRTGSPTLEWRCRKNEADEMVFACPSCAPTLAGRPV